jgi:UDP-3-O-[3-hydroxymyristoyl] N-acetylglucosamine deacetylase
MQHTVTRAITITDIGLHSGQDITMTIHPARVDNGIVFIRTDMAGQDNIIPARWDMVVDTRLCTVVANDSGAQVGTIEHLMAALRGCGIDNAVIEIDGGEIPAMDGSSMPFVKRIKAAGITQQTMPRRAIKILRSVRYEDDDKWATLTPAKGSIFGGKIDFDHQDIGTQSYKTTLVNGNFVHDIAQARTFGFLHEVEYMRTQGLARGGSLDNAIVLDKNGVMNEGGLRFKDEFIRHKLLDAIGDLYLAGGVILGTYDSYRAGHDVNNKLLHALFAHPENWEMADVYDGDDLPCGQAAEVQIPLASA